MNWCEPPPDSRTTLGRGAVALDLALTRDNLKSSPRRWALIYTSSSAGWAQNALTGKIPGLNPDGLEFTTRKVSGGNWDIYARWVEA